MRRATLAAGLVLAIGVSPLGACLPNGVKDASKMQIWQGDGLPSKATLLNRMIPQRFLGTQPEWIGADGAWTASVGPGVTLTARDKPNGEAASYTLVASERPASVDKGSPMSDFVVAATPPHLVSDAQAAARKLQIFSDSSEPAQATIGTIVFRYTPAGAGYRIDAAPVSARP